MEDPGGALPEPPSLGGRVCPGGEAAEPRCVRGRAVGPSATLGWESAPSGWSTPRSAGLRPGPAHTLLSLVPNPPPAAEAQLWFRALSRVALGQRVGEAAASWAFPTGAWSGPRGPHRTQPSARLAPHLPAVREAPECWAALGGDSTQEGCVRGRWPPPCAVSRPSGWTRPQEPVGKQMLSLLSFAAHAAPRGGQERKVPSRTRPAPGPARDVARERPLGAE